MIERRIVIGKSLGLHARAAAKFVELASQFRCSVRVATAARATEGKSILGLLLLAASQGSSIVITTEGVDETAAPEALEARAIRGFDVA